MVAVREGMSNPTLPITIRFLHLSALPLVVIAGALAGACGGEAGTTGAGGSTSATTGTTTTGTTTSTTSATTGTGGAAMNPDPCDPLAQDCVEAVASKCTVHLGDMGAISADCEAPLGDKKLDEICLRPTGEAGVDTCEKGLYCAFFGNPVSSPQQRSCLALCDAPGSCAQGKECAGIGDSTLGVCGPVCAPYTAACGAGTKCSVVGLVGGDAGFLCTPLGTKAAGEACAGALECGADMGCRNFGAGFVCTSYCNDAHLCADASAHCSAYPDPALAGWGACVPSSYSCLGSVTWDPPLNAKESVQVVAFDAFSGDVLPGAKVKVCAANDAACAAPLAQGTAAADGSVVVEVPTVGAGFDGYFEVSLAGKLTSLVYANKPIASSGQVISGVLLGLADIETSIKGPATANLARGLLFGLGLDCQGQSAGGVAFTVSTADASSIVAHGLPSAEYAGVHPDCVDPAATSSSVGIALGMNLPVGMATVSVQVPGAPALGSKAVQFRAGALTFVAVEPAP